MGMKVMVTENLETDLDITNGARGEIINLILHPDEPPIPSTPIVHLKFLPAFILVKLQKTKALQLPGLESGVIPVEPKHEVYCQRIGRVQDPRQNTTPISTHSRIRLQGLPSTGSELIKCHIGPRTPSWHTQPVRRPVPKLRQIHDQTPA